MALKEAVKAPDENELQDLQVRQYMGRVSLVSDVVLRELPLMTYAKLLDFLTPSFRCLQLELI